MSSTAINWGGPIHIHEHAMWRAAERFPFFDTATIEQEVRSALSSGRVSSERAHLGLRPTADPASLYVWTEDGERVYAIRCGADKFYVITTMNKEGR